MKSFLLAACLASAALAAAASDVPLTIAEAQRRAVDRSTQVTAQEAAISASRHMAVAAAQLPDPTLKAGLDNVPISGPDRYSLSSDQMTMRRIGLMQEITGSEKRQLRSERYELEAQKSAAERAATIANIQRDAALAWLDRYYAESMSALIAEQVAQAKLEIEGAESAYRAGRGNQADVFNARTAQAALEDRASEYRRRAANAKVALARFIGEDARRPLAGKPALDTTAMHGRHLPSELASHPMIAVLQKSEEIAATDARLASANRSPDWSVEVTYQNRGSAFPDMVSVGVSIPLQWDRPRRQDEELASKLAMSQQAVAARADALQAHIAEVEAMLAEWDDDRSRLARYEKELIPLARERNDATLAAYRGARASLMDVLAARRAELEVRALALQLELETARLWAQLSFLEPDETVLPAKMVGAQRSTTMNARNVLLGAVALALVAGGGYGLWTLGVSQGKSEAAAPAAQPGKKVLYWHDPMTPGSKFDKPGKSPYMDMQLVPVYEGEAAADGVAISAQVQQSLGVRLADVVEGDVTPKLEAVGSVAWNDRDAAVVQARANGFLEKLFVRAPLDPVVRGQALAELYVPDWVAAQEEFLSTGRMQGRGIDELRDAAKQRMRLAGMSEEQVALVEREGKVHPRLTLVAPISGVVSELAAREGMTVAAGAPLFRINGLATVWLNAEVPEGIAAQVRPGNTVQARAAALPGEIFKGHVSAVLPEVSAATRTLKVRIELVNASGRLVPGMFATIDFAPAARRTALLVPTEAVIQTGERSVVMVAETGANGSQRFRAVDVETGVDAGGMTEIRKGLAAGQKVVASGQFLIDSEASLKAGSGRLGEAAAGAKP